MNLSINGAGVMYCKGAPAPQISNETNVVAFVNEHGSVDVVQASKFNSEQVEPQINKLIDSECNNEMQKQADENNIINNNNKSSIINTS